MAYFGTSSWFELNGIILITSTEPAWNDSSRSAERRKKFRTWSHVSLWARVVGGRFCLRVKLKNEISGEPNGFYEDLDWIINGVDDYGSSGMIELRVGSGRIHECKFGDRDAPESWQARMIRGVSKDIFSRVFKELAKKTWAVVKFKLMNEEQVQTFIRFLTLESLVVSPVTSSDVSPDVRQDVLRDFFAGVSPDISPDTSSAVLPNNVERPPNQTTPERPYFRNIITDEFILKYCYGFHTGSGAKNKNKPDVSRKATLIERRQRQKQREGASAKMECTGSDKEREGSVNAVEIKGIMLFIKEAAQDVLIEGAEKWWPQREQDYQVS